MKNTLIILGLLILMSCTENQRARRFGGTETIKLSPNEKLVTVAWKEDDSMWILTREMNIDDKVETYNFKEKSSLGLMEGNVTIVESK